MKIYTDGACSGNPGPGSWAAVIYGETTIEISGHSDKTTNNTMELTAILKAVDAIENAEVTIYTDSQAAIGWITGSWKAKKPHIANLVSQIRQTCESKKITMRLEYVRGHSGVQGNERANTLAQEAINELRNRTTNRGD
jgi:ribonuclease HI